MPPAPMLGEVAAATATATTTGSGRFVDLTDESPLWVLRTRAQSEAGGVEWKDFAEATRFDAISVEVPLETRRDESEQLERRFTLYFASRREDWGTVLTASSSTGAGAAAATPTSPRSPSGNQPPSPGSSPSMSRQSSGAGAGANASGSGSSLAGTATGSSSSLTKNLRWGLGSALRGGRKVVETVTLGTVGRQEVDVFVGLYDEDGAAILERTAVLSPASESFETPIVVKQEQGLCSLRISLRSSSTLTPIKIFASLWEDRPPVASAPTPASAALATSTKPSATTSTASTPATEEELDRLDEAEAARHDAWVSTHGDRVALIRRGMFSSTPMRTKRESLASRAFASSANWLIVGLAAGLWLPRSSAFIVSFVAVVVWFGRLLLQLLGPLFW